jgi:muramoyltetrapeptide carboxypeptidase LdcA involved in peptidoglycan recycling
MQTSLLAPKRLKLGDTIGVFTPSSPAYKINPGLFENGVRTLEGLGFKVKLGSLTARRAVQGYRSGSGQERAAEFMDLITDPTVDALVSTIGGYNSNSMIPFLDFSAIRDARKPICGASDVTSLHLAIMKFSGLRTYYGPTVMCWFGDWPEGDPESTSWFLDAVMNHEAGVREVKAPARWSNHKRDWTNGDWKNKPRDWQENQGWKVLQPGVAEAPILAANLNTMMSAAGTKYWPDFKGRILLIEEMDAPLMREERSLRQLSLTGAFDEIMGLIVSKPEVYSADGAPFDFDHLIQEIVGSRDYPIVTNFDCGHTLPTITIPEGVRVKLEAGEQSVSFKFLESAFSE